MQCPSLQRLIVQKTLLWSSRRVCHPFRSKTSVNVPLSDSGTPDKDHTPGSNTLLPLLDIEDRGRRAFKHKRMSELLRSYFVFHLCSYPLLVKHSPQLMDVGKKLLGRRLFSHVMRRTFYGQFVGGATMADLGRSIDDLRALCIGAMLCVPIEEDVGGQSESSEKYERNMKILLNCVALSRDMDDAYPHSQMKITSVVPAHICLRIAELYPNPTKTPNVFDSMADILAGTKTTLEGLSPGENKLLVDATGRMNAIGQAAAEQGVFLLLDAEYIRMNPALKVISLAMMLRFNKARPVISYTYQAYLKETFELLVADEQFIRSRGVCFGLKLVRGAYLNQERHLAAEEGYPDPVNPTFVETSDMYRRSAGYMLERVAAQPDIYYVMIATHNETTVLEAVDKMKRDNIAPANGAVFFGSLYGMSDYLASTLGEAGYRVYKSIPYGTVDETIPYLYRRAVENGSILGSTQKERTLLRRAILRRLTFGIL